MVTKKVQKHTKGKLSKFTQPRKKLDHLASFPEMNPNPVMEINIDGSIEYLNPASQTLFPDLQEKGLQHEWLVDLKSLVGLLNDQKRTSYVREIMIDGNWYQQSFHIAPGPDRIRIYGLNITERKQMEKELRKSRDELDLRIQERTAELEKANKELIEQSRIMESFLKNTSNPFVFLDKNFNFIRVNDAYAKACQRDIMEFPGHNHFEFYPHEENEAIFRRVVETRVPFQTFAKPFSFPDHPEWGTTYWDWTLTPLLGPKGEVEYLVFSLQDVTERRRIEKERAQLIHILETTSDLVGMANLDGQLFYLNKAGRKMLGFSEEEDISSMRISDTHPDWASDLVLHEGIPTALQTGLWKSETAFLSRNGTEIPVSQVILAHKNPEGMVEFLSTIARDITDIKRAQQALEAERKRFYDILEVIPAYLVLLTPDYHVPFANRFFRGRFGESNGQRCFEYLFGRSEPCETCESYTALKTMAPHEWEWTGPDGRHYDVFDYPFTDTDGSILILEMGIDITERKRAEEALRQSEMKYRIVADNTYDWEWWMDLKGNFIYISPSCKRITHHDAEEFIQDSDLLLKMIHPDDRSPFIGHQIKVEEKPTSGEMEFRILHPDGSFRWIAHACQPIFDEQGHFWGRRGSNRDITERKLAEEALRESERHLHLLSSQLLSAQEDERKRIAREIHDSIGQTLAAIKFGLESKLSQMGGDSPPPGILIENIISLAQNGIEEARRIQMDLRPSILDDLGILATLQWFCREFEKIYSTIHIEKQTQLLENDISEGLKTVIYRVIQEALNNVAKYSKATRVSLSLNEQEGGVELVIEDNGIGFDVESAQKGFGLGSMRERIELSGGSFEIESTVGKGTRIRANWPI